MNRPIIRRDEARQDLLEQFTYIGQDSADAAHRFLAAAEAAFERLAEMPGSAASRCSGTLICRESGNGASRASKTT